jgi:glutathione S-transferase
MLTLYDSADSGNAYKVRLALAHLGLPYERIALDTDNGETRTSQFRAVNPNGKVPTLALDDIALYAYTHVADEGEFDLQDFPGIRGWIARVADRPGHVLISDD